MNDKYNQSSIAEVCRSVSRSRRIRTSPGRTVCVGIGAVDTRKQGSTAYCRDAHAIASFPMSTRVHTGCLSRWTRGKAPGCQLAWEGVGEHQGAPERWSINSPAVDANHANLTCGLSVSHFKSVCHLLIRSLANIQPGWGVAGPSVVFGRTTRSSWPFARPFWNHDRINAFLKLITVFVLDCSGANHHLKYSASATRSPDPLGLTSSLDITIWTFSPHLCFSLDLLDLILWGGAPDRTR